MNQVLWLTGLPCSGKTTIAKALSEIVDAEILDGDEMRSLLHNTDFSPEGRKKHMLAIAELANRFSKHVPVVVALVSPLRAIREEIGKKYPHVQEIFIKCSLDECIRRDVKGMYKKALAGEIKDFTGIGQPYEEPENAFVVDTENESLQTSANAILDAFFKKEKHSLFIGRYQPLHDGHIKLISKVLDEGRRVCVALRDTPISDSDPYSVAQRKKMFYDKFQDRVKVISIPDIDDVCHGRKVGWGIREIRLDENVESISGTKIREEQNITKPTL